jgi:DNA-binding transcriptional regulator YiaG
MLTGAEIKRVREALDESQQTFGNRFGVDQSTVHRWEEYGPPARGAALKSLERTLPELRKKIPAAQGASA